MQIVMVSNEEKGKIFIKEIGEETVPEEYGGQAKLVALQDVTLTQLEGWTKDRLTMWLLIEMQIYKLYE